jgi:hypothetical protein
MKLPVSLGTVFMPSRRLRRTAVLIIGVLAMLAAAAYLFSGAQQARAAADLSVSINTAYNLVVDSNVSSPSTYAPRAATVYGTFCNDGNETLTDVYGYIGNYNGGSSPTPGLYPERDSTAAPFITEHPWAGNTGDYAFTHIGGTSDASRYIGDIGPGECKVQYWSFTYPACANTPAGAAVEPACTTTPTWGDSVKPHDDLWLQFDIWATGIDSSSLASLNDNARHTMTMRNEISAMANKIKPNPDGEWFNTDTTTIVPGAVITTNGVLYTLGNIRQGFDNDGDFVPDYNAWLQPFGDPSYDPSCFRLIRTSTVLTVTRSSGQPNLVFETNDLTPHPTYGGPLYFTNLPPDNTGVDGEVRYTFLALNGPCSVPISPYQEVASGSDNEKFNGDYGTGIPNVQSSAPEVTISKSGPDTVGENVQFTYSIPFENTSDTYSAGLTLNSGGVNMPLVIRDEVPDGLQYEANSAATGNTNPTGCGSNCYTIRYSTDSGVTWTTTDPGNTVSTHPNGIVKIEWWLTNPLPTNGTGIVTFQARVPSGYIAGGGDPFIVNEACANFGAGTDFACATDVTMVTGNNSVGDFVWADANANGLQDGGEVGIPDITVWLYWDFNGNGLLDDGDLLIAEDVTDSNGAYGFAQLPDGNYLVVVDSEDGDLPTGYANTTPAVIAVPLDPTSADVNPVAVTTADFGFGPVLSLEKTLTSGNPAYEGQLVTFDLELTNNLPGDGTGQETSCEYIVWANSATTANTPKDFTAPANMQGLPDGIYAEGAWVNGSNEWAYGFDFDGLATLDVSNITQVEGLLPIYTSQTLTNDFLSIHWITAAIANNAANPGTGAEATDAIPTATVNSYLNNPGTLSWVIWDLGVDGPWVWPSLNDVAWKLVVEPNKVGGSDGGTLFVDAVGLRITTSGGCGGPAGTIDPLPLTDSYDADKLEFVSAIPAESATGTAVTPYANTGTISWDNLGPLHAGGTQTVQVTFRVLEPAGNAATDTINYAAVNGATFSNGRPTNQPTDSAPVDIEPTGSIGDTIWNDLDSNGSQNGEPGLAGILVSLTASTDVTINGVTYTAGNVIMTAVTDANGEYLFEGLPDASYTVTVDNTSLPGMAPTYDADGHVGTPNQSTTTISGANDDDLQDFGYTIPIIIYGNVWQDFDGDGAEDADEAPIASVDVTLYRWDGAIWQPIATLATDTNGDYLFDAGTYPAMLAGEYYVATNPGTLPVGPTWSNTYDPDGDFDDESGTIVVGAGEISGSHDFGYHQTGPHSISGNVYADWDSDADLNNNDTGFGGILVTLYSDTGAVIATTTTAADGSYTFPSLPNGDYTVVVDESSLPPQYSQTENYGEVGQCTICGGQADVTINGGPVSGVDFGYEPAGYGTIGDFVWEDSNGDGFQQPGELLNGLPNVTVNLYVDYGDGDGYVLVATTVTDADGLYSFGNLPPGDYRVEVDTADPEIPDDSYGNNYVTTTPTTYDVALASGQTHLDADFGFAPGGVIGDTIYWDANGNADQDWNEDGIPGVDVTLEVWNGSAWATYATDSTDSAGNYLFTGLPAGEYRVVVDSGAGSPVENNELTGDPDTNGIPCFPDPGAPWTSYCDSMQEVEIRPGQTYLGADFGYQPTGVIGDFVWLDSDGDGVQDAGEPGLADVTVYLCNAQPCDGSVPGNIVETTTTDYEGYYSFINVGVGTWYVGVDESTLPAGLAPTYDLDGGDDSETAVTLPNAGDSNLDADFGYRLNGTYALSGTVYYDLNQSGGDQEVNEPGYVGQTVYLWQLVGSSYVQVGSTTTDADGNYSFTNLPAGSYVVSTNATSPILNNAEHTSTPTQNDDTAYELVTIVAQSIENVDFGFFLGTDFDDLPNTYQTLLSGGAYHINTGVGGTLRLGATIDLEPNGLPSVQADSEGNFDDGVVRDPADQWVPGATVDMTIEVNGGPGVVGGWIDWDGNGTFEADEFVSFGSLPNGINSVSVVVPATGYTTGDPLYARFRVFDPANIPGGTLTADDYDGGATGGEVEGYYWLFEPTAVTLQSFNTSSHPANYVAIGSLFLIVTAGVFLLLRRRNGNL